MVRDLPACVCQAVRGDCGLQGSCSVVVLKWRGRRLTGGACGVGFESQPVGCAEDTAML